MGKLIIAVLSIIGALYLLKAHLPSAWAQGVALGGYHIPYAAFLLAGVGLLVWRIKVR